jgi:hypothetical protein
MFTEPSLSEEVRKQVKPKENYEDGHAVNDSTLSGTASTVPLICST